MPGPVPSAALRCWTPDEMPESVRAQVLAFMRQAWPEGFRGPNLLRAWIHPPQDNPMHVVALLPNGCVAAHASALRRDFSAFGRNWAIGGLSGVFSFAHVRGMGYGKAVVLRATELLEGRGLDAGLFCCDRENVGFYRSCGWELLPGHPILVGNPPAPDPSATMFRAFSPDGAELRDRLAGGTLEFGDYVW